MAGQAVYWVGADNNVYLKAPETDTSGTWKVTNMGPASQVLQGTVYPGAVQIADPNAPAPTAPTNPNGTTAAAAPVFNQAGADNTQRAIDQIGPLLQAALDAEANQYGNTVSGFNSQEQTQRGNYDKSTTTNQQNYDSNFMDSIRAGIQGLHGLFAVLRGTGGGGGTAEKQVRDTVGGVTSNDIRTGKDTRDENQGGLDASLSQFLTDLQLKRKAAEDTRVNNERAIRRDSNTQLQDLYSKMAGFYGDVGNTAASNDWMNRAGALIPEIAANSRAQVSKYDATPVAVQAPQLSAFAETTQPSVVTAPDGQVGSGIFTMTDSRRRKEQAPPLVPVGV